jgi:CRISPR-associated exonuclease Cas4
MKVRVSDLVQYMICPRRLYFLMKGYEFFDERRTLKSVSFAQSEEDVKKEGEEDLLPLWRELQKFPAEKRKAFRREYMVESEKLNLSGCVDKVILLDGELIPSLIKTGPCPKIGVWKTDRIQLAGYAMLLEEDFSKEVSKGFVEYILVPELREVNITKWDRRVVLSLIKKIERMEEFPRKGRTNCKECCFLEKCRPKRSLLSRILSYG